MLNEGFAVTGTEDGSFPDHRGTPARLRVLIADDEPLSRERVRSLVERAGQVEIVGECTDGVQAIRAIQVDPPDLAFLDVEMPELSGLDVVAALEPDRCPQVVFITAHERYLQRAFEVHAIDYLRKPFTDDRFYDALRHARRRVEERRESAEAHRSVIALLAQLRQHAGHERDRVVIRDLESGAYQVVRADSIDWIEAHDGAALVHAGKDGYPTRQTLAVLEQRLDPAVFLRIHRSFIVNRTRISKVELLWKGEYAVTLESGKKLGTGRTYRAAVEAFLDRS
jgi:two-component system LytT family response regulator